MLSYLLGQKVITEEAGDRTGAQGNASPVPTLQYLANLGSLDEQGYGEWGLCGACTQCPSSSGQSTKLLHCLSLLSSLA